MKSLGITPDQVEGTYGKTLIPDTPDAQQRLKAALDAIGKGIDTSGQYRGIDVYVKRNGVWRAVAAQFTATPRH